MLDAPAADAKWMAHTQSPAMHATWSSVDSELSDDSSVVQGALAAAARLPVLQPVSGFNISQQQKQLSAKSDEIAAIHADDSVLARDNELAHIAELANSKVRSAQRVAVQELATLQRSSLWWPSLQCTVQCPVSATLPCAGSADSRSTFFLGTSGGPPGVRHVQRARAPGAVHQRALVCGTGK
jgi:hypothetical protein